MREWEGRFEELVSDAASLWQSTANHRACHGDYSPFWLYYRPAGERTYGELRLEPEGTVPESPWTLGDSEPYRCNLNRDAVRKRVHSVARRLPVLPSGGAS